MTFDQARCTIDPSNDATESASTDLVISRKLALPAVASGAKAKPPTWAQSRTQHWKKIEADFEAGCRDQETVCAYAAHEAAKKALVNWNVGSIDELVSTGYCAAMDRWSQYDPTKASAKGIAGFLYKVALSAMRNDAHKLFTAHGKYKHRENDVLPAVSIIADVEAIPTIRSEVSRPAASSDDIHHKSSKPVPSPERKDEKTLARTWAHDYVISPAGLTEKQYTRQARIAAEIYIHDLLALLPRVDRELIEKAWGLDGVTKATVQELAELGQCSESTVRRRLERLYEEIRQRATKLGRCRI